MTEAASAAESGPGKWRSVALIAVVELLAMSLWFSASAVVPQLTVEWDLGGGGASWMTMSVQLGFVVGALASALLTLSDRVAPPVLIALSALFGALANGAIVLMGAPGPALVLRFLTGVTLAGVYPPGMKLVATWCREDRGLGIGILVGALTLGSALPHLLNAVPFFGGVTGIPPWREVLLATSGLAIVAALLAALVREGPHRSAPAPFDWRYAGRVLTDPAIRLANFGYLGHMWELYAMWAWVPVMLLASYQAGGLDPAAARIAGFAVVGVGALGCVAAGRWADRFGRSTVASWSLVVSGGCALSAGLFFGSPLLLTAVCLLWGFAVVADSAQFSAAVTELADARYTGTALTLQVSLGFLLTLATIRMIPPLERALGWRWAFAALALGPVFGIVSMMALRRRPEAVRLAGGRG